jgi:hypothetical protein
LKDVECWQRTQEFLFEKLSRLRQHENIVFENGAISVFALSYLLNRKKMAKCTADLGWSQHSAIIDAALRSHFIERVPGHVPTVYRVKKSEWDARGFKVTTHDCAALLASL